MVHGNYSGCYPKELSFLTYREMGNWLSFFSFTPFLYKLNALKPLIFRGYKISSNILNMHSDFDFLHSFFIQNGFPSYLIFKQVGNFFR